MKILCALVMITMIGCSSILPMLGKTLMGSASKGISVDSQLGDRENDVRLGGVAAAKNIIAEDNATVNVTASQTDSNVERANTVIVKNYDPWILVSLIAVIALFVPSPMGYLKRKFKWLQITPQQR